MIKQRIRLEFACTVQGLKDLSEAIQPYLEQGYTVEYGTITTATPRKVIVEVEKPVE